MGGARRLSCAARTSQQTRRPRLLSAPALSTCSPHRPGAAAMRLALLWALGLLGAGSPLPSRPLPNTGEFPAASGWRASCGEVQGSRWWGYEVLESWKALRRVQTGPKESGLAMECRWTEE